MYIYVSMYSSSLLLFILTSIKFNELRNNILYNYIITEVQLKQPGGTLMGGTLMNLERQIFCSVQCTYHKNLRSWTK